MTTARKSIADQPQTRRERRAATRAERSARRDPRRATTSRPAWRSPFALVTLGAILVGALFVGYALLSRPSVSPDSLREPIGEVPVSLADGRTLGRAAAPVTLDLWADFQCPGCGQLATRVEPPLISQFVTPGMARIVFHDAAFQGAKSSSSWDESVMAASAARCAADQNLFWQMNDWLFANQIGENVGSFTGDRLRAIAQSAGLEMPAYEACMAANTYPAQVRAETADALSQGINQTPTILINGTRYIGAMSLKSLGDAIAAASGGASPAPAAAT